VPDVVTFDDLGQAASALSAGRGARFLAGGTLVMRALNEGDQEITSIVRTTDPAFRRIQGQGERVVIGAGVTMSQILASRELDFLHPVARVIGGPAVRNMATVGGNLFAPAPYGDLTAALLVAETTVATAGSFGAREIGLEDLLRERDRQPRPLIASLTVTRPRHAADFRFLKVSRVRPKGVAVLSIAAHLPSAGGRLARVRVAYNGMAPMPIRALAVERALEGKNLDEAGIAAAIAAAAEGTAPADDALASAWYRREVLPVHLKRLLLGQTA
jgi:CO/xanthine dehydrogenase FAD-binding subunit